MLIFVFQVMCPIWNLGPRNDSTLEGMHCGWRSSITGKEECQWTSLPFQYLTDHPLLANQSRAQGCIFFDGSILYPEDTKSAADRDVYLRMRITSPYSDDEAREKIGLQ